LSPNSIVVTAMIYPCMCSCPAHRPSVRHAVY